MNLQNSRSWLAREGGSILEGEFPDFITETLPGVVYFVDGNKTSDSNDGLSWENAFKYLSTAMAASHANIAITANRNWAGRNTILVKGDDITEDLTTLAQKTDIIGVGSNDAYGKASVIGTWIIPATVNYVGCRFYNMMFTDTGANAIFDIDGQDGIEFHDCLFDSAASTTYGIYFEECNWFLVDNCEFSRVSASLGFSTAAICIVQDDDVVYGSRINNCRISTAGIGIDWNETASYNCWITKNYIYATGLTVDCESDNVFVVDNRMMTDVDCDSYAVGTGFDWAVKVSAGNILMGDGSGAIANEVPPIE